MDPNNSNQQAEPVLNPVEIPTQPAQQPMHNQKVNLTIILGVLLLLLVVAGGAYYLGNQYSNYTPQPQNTNAKPTNNKTTNPTDSPVTTPIPQSKENTNWKTFTGSYVTFRYPDTWSPQRETPFGGQILEAIKLGIPGVESDQSLSFSQVNVEDARPDDIISESQLVIGGKDGYKWIRKGENYVSYDYITTGYNNNGSFSVHVTVPKEDKNLERQLDTLVQSITFK